MEAYIEQLQRIVPAHCFMCNEDQGHTDECRCHRYPLMRLSIDPPLPGNVVGWGHIGNFIVSYAIVHIWTHNELIQPALEEPSHLWVLSEKGQMVAERKIKESEITLPNSGWWASRTAAVGAVTEAEEADEVVEGLLFSRAGTCQYCRANMDKFGQISHAKSHIGKGHPIVIEEINGKKIAKIKPGSEMPVPVATPTRAAMTIDHGEVSGNELYTSTGVCQLCPAGTPTVHIFGRISHAKSHIGKGHPVEIRTIKKKSIPIIVGSAPDQQVEGGSEPGQEPSPEKSPGEVHEARLRLELGIEAMQAFARLAQLDDSREAAQAAWENMTEFNQGKTLEAYAALEG